MATWHKAEGDTVARDELIVEIETDKVVMEVVAPVDGVLTSIKAAAGTVVNSEQLLALIEPGDITQASGTSRKVESADTSQATKGAAPAASGQGIGPAARTLLEEHKLDATAVKGRAMAVESLKKT